MIKAILKNNIYIFSGLGADERVFQKIDFSGNSITFINWILPLKKNETIENYASRLLNQIKTPDPILVGLSFGGIMTIEVAKQIKTHKVILISSAKTRNEIPFYYRIAGILKLDRIVSAKLLKHSNIITNYFFGTTSEFDKDLLRTILKETDHVFLKWAIHKILNWTNKTIPKNTIHIHGTKDRIIPIWSVASDIQIKNGGHLMTLNKATELTGVVNDLLL